MASKTRRCIHCGEDKPLNSDNFGLDSSQADRIRRRCKVCENEASAISKAKRAVRESEAKRGK